MNPVPSTLRPGFMGTWGQGLLRAGTGISLAGESLVVATRAPGGFTSSRFQPGAAPDRPFQRDGEQ